jgi:hypothetical protein
VTLCQETPEVASVPDHPTTGPHQPLPQTGQRPVLGLGAAGADGRRNGSRQQPETESCAGSARGEAIRCILGATRKDKNNIA